MNFIKRHKDTNNCRFFIRNYRGQKKVMQRLKGVKEKNSQLKIMSNENILYLKNILPSRMKEK